MFNLLGTIQFSKWSFYNSLWACIPYQMYHWLVSTSRKKLSTMSEQAKKTSKECKWPKNNWALLFQEWRQNTMRQIQISGLSPKIRGWIKILQRKSPKIERWIGILQNKSTKITRVFRSKNTKSRWRSKVFQIKIK